MAHTDEKEEEEGVVVAVEVEGREVIGSPKKKVVMALTYLSLSCSIEI
tara:strand:- start:1099 stop:1242 length:144 start_codon:yes stop_codon:yes gene_type:complete